jgi:adenylosuccinate lyase
MSLSELTAISPIDGRYRLQTQELAPYFSEFGLIRYRVKVEIEYFIALVNLQIPQLQDFPTHNFEILKNWAENFTKEDALKIKEIEKTTNHDVKAVEYFLKDKFKDEKLEKYQEFIHFGLTSQDINNTAIPISIKESVEKIMLPKLWELTDKIQELATQWQNVPMLAHTHGQPASPTTLGKELKVFSERLQQQILYFKQIPNAAKFGGATGNFNAHKIAYPNIDWITFGNNFVNNTLHLHRSQTTTQIEHYDHLAALLDAFKRTHTILIDMARDIWQYISMNYFKQKIKENEVGSSAMPHKVNPIDFENAEGNLLYANAILEFLAAKLPISRLQRDLTDSTVLRNLGVPLGHSLLAYKSLLKGLNKLELNPKAIETHLEDNWAVVAEAIQTILRRENYPQPYETLKNLTRTGEKITETSIKLFIEALQIEETVKNELRNITPYNYIGMQAY